jgi:hypothetical protein
MKKKINIVLLIAVISLWGTVIYRYVNRFFSDAPIPSIVGNTQFVTSRKNSVKDTFELTKIARDPFLGEFVGPITKPASNAKALNTKPKIKKELPKVAEKRFPSVVYYGYIKGIDKSHETILLRVDGSFLKLQLNQDKNGLKVVALKNDSIKVLYNRESKWFVKK